MKTTKTGGSISQDIMDIICTFEQEQFLAFEKFAKEKRKKTDYGYLFDYMYQLKEAGETSDTHNEAKVKNWFLQFKKKENPRYFRDASETLYKRLVAFMGQTYKRQEQEKWRLELAKGLDEVEALMANNLKQHALAHFLNIEKKIPGKNEISRYHWNDTSVIMRAACLKVALCNYDSKELLSMSDRENVLMKLNKSFEHFYTWQDHLPTESNVFQLLNLEQEQHFAFRLLHLYGQQYDSLKDQMEGIDGILGTEIPLILSKRPNYYPDQGKLEAISQEHKAFWLIQKMVLHLDNMEFRQVGIDRKNTLEAFQEISEQIFNKALLANIQNMYMQLGLVAAIGQKEEGETVLEYLKENLDALYLFTEKEIAELPLRLELNTAIYDFVLGAVTKCDKRITQLLQTRKQNKILDLRVLECLVHFELEKENADDLMRRFRNLVKKRENIAFEAAFSRLFSELARWSGKDGRIPILKREQKAVVKLEKSANPYNPVHQLVLDWIKKVTL